MATDLSNNSIAPDDFAVPLIPTDDQESGAVAVRRHVKKSKKRNRNQITDNLDELREYLSDPSPDPQWEKLKAILSVMLDIFWIIASMAVFHLTDFYIKVRYDRRIDRNWLMYSLIAVGVDLAIAAYYVGYLACLRGISADAWDNHWRWGYAIATVSFFVSAVTFTVAAWEIWWIFTPIILFLFFMGFVTVLSYIPSWGGDFNSDKNNNATSSTKRSSTADTSFKTI